MQVPSGLIFVRRHQDGIRGERARQGVRGDVSLHSAGLRGAHRTTLAAGMSQLMFPDFQSVPEIASIRILKSIVDVEL